MAMASNGDGGSFGGSGVGKSWEEIIKSTSFRPKFPSYSIEGRKIKVNKLKIIY